MAKTKFEIKKLKYDYYYDKDGNKIVTVCYILTVDGILGRGVSVCSIQDVFDEATGKVQAERHAARAIKGRSLDSFSRKEVIHRLIQCKCPFTKRGERFPVLSWWEARFLFGVKIMYKYQAYIACRIKQNTPHAMSMAQLLCDPTIIIEGSIHD